VRRQSNKRNGALKILTAAAVVAAMSAGSLTAFADTVTNPRILVDMGNGSVKEILVSELATNDAYRDAVINAFNASNTMLVEQVDGTWNEISEHASVDNGVANAVVDYEESEFFDKDTSPFAEYMN
jgi:hypothetical protein